MQRVRQILLLLMLTLLCCGCINAKQRYTGDWPLTQLTAPPNSTLIESDKPKASGGTLNGQLWTNKYHCEKDPQSVFTHVEGCLKPLDYEEFWTDHPNGKSMRGMLRTYYSPDHLTKISVGINPKASALSNPDKPNIVIGIELLERPDEYVKSVGAVTSDGSKVRLEPIK